MHESTRDYKARVAGWDNQRIAHEYATLVNTEEGCVNGCEYRYTYDLVKGWLDSGCTFTRDHCESTLVDRFERDRTRAARVDAMLDGRWQSPA